MGIGFSHGGASWSYSGFNEFRALLAKDVGIELYDMDGYFTKEEISKGTAFLREYGKYDWPSKKPWSEIEDEALLPLLNHSDCEGVLTPEECAQVAPRIREIISKWPNQIDCDEFTMDNYDKIQGRLLADGMEVCAETNCDFKFH